MKARFIKHGNYAHVNDARTPQFYITETEAKEGKVVGGLSQLTIDTYVESGACQPLEGDEALEEVDKETEDEESDSDDVTLTSITGDDESKKKKRKRGRGSRN